MKVPFLNLPLQYELLKEEIDKAISEVIESGRFIMGDKVTDFEEKIGEYIGSKAISCASGSDALFISLKAAGVGPSDEVITSPFTFFATAGAIARAGGTPVFVDTKNDTHNIDPNLIEDKITKKTKAIIPVHIFGLMSDMDKITRVAKKHGLMVIEDACQAIGSKNNGKSAGSVGDFATFSFFPTKNLGAYGDGGLITVKREDHYQYLKMFRLHGSKKKYFHEFVGINSRLDAIQAAILSVKLNYLEEWNKKRRKIAQIYNKELKDFVDIPAEPDGKYHIYHQYSITTEKRDDLKTYLKDKDIDTVIYYPLPLHLQECFKDLGYKKDDMPNSEKSAATVLSLPIFPEITEDQIHFVITTIREYFR